jgi:uncharacterized protein with PIN domain
MALTLKQRVDQPDREIAAIRKLVLTGMKMLVRLENSQRETDRMLKELIRSPQTGGNGRGKPLHLVGNRTFPEAVRARFRFYAELNDFLPPGRRMVMFDYPFEGRQTVKHLIESLGVPHTEVDLVLVNGQSVNFAELIADGDLVSVYPVFEGFDITPVSRVRPKPLRQTRFVLDAHLGRLASYLRMAGFDSLYRNDYDDRELARISADEHRILLTRDRGLLMRSAVTHGYYVRETVPRRQLEEVVRRFDLAASLDPFTRCMACNERLRAVAKEAAADRMPSMSRAHYDDLCECPGCGRVFWKGSHYRRMERILETVSFLRVPRDPPGI